MKIILSRKGFDSTSGGYPSPILDGNRLVSFPIPENMNLLNVQEKEYVHKYANLRVNDNLSYLDLMKQLLPDKEKQLKLEKENIVLDKNTVCHLDPQINNPNIYNNGTEYCGLFGQSGSANSHLLKTCNVSKGDLFLFFGWFRDAYKIDEKYKYIPEKGFTDKHVIWGWLEIGEIKNVSEIDKINNKFKGHPHVWKTGDKNNYTIYISTDKLSIDNRLPGAGLFPYNDLLVLTKEGMPKSKWDLPEFFKGKISYHDENNFKKDYFQSTYRGQEFVTETDDKILKWVKNKFSILKDCENE